jgi:trehalose 6-phosphate synthase
MPSEWSGKGQLVVVSNRVTVASPKKATQAGGLAVGLLAALREVGGIWFGWSGETTLDTPGPVRRQRSGSIQYALTDISAEDFEDYYNNFANRTLWPLFHYRIDLATYNHRWYAAYRRVNRFFAERLQPLLGPDDIVWIHDYHLLPLATELRRLGVQNRLAFFLHIPFPAPDMFATLPWQRELAFDLCNYDIVGFQTATDVRQFLAYIELELEGRAEPDGWSTVGERRFRAAAIPIGIDPDEFLRMVEQPEAIRQRQRLEASLGGRKLIIGVDRLDYTKGIPERLRAFEALLESMEPGDTSVSFVQISAPSRSDVPEYQRLRVEVETLSGHINGRFSEADWVPLRYLNRSFSRTALAGMFQLSRIGLVTPLRDGMNLVAKEYVAAQDQEDPGVLVLSRFAGAAGELDGALVVNPYDIYQVARAMDAGLTMPLDERKDRFRRMMTKVREHDITAWWSNSLRLLRERPPVTAA